MAWHEPILAAFKVIRVRAGRWHDFCCPAHEDRVASATAWLGADGDRILFGCRAGCPKEAILAALGLKMRDMFEPSERRATRGQPRRVVACYDYLDEGGRVLYQNVRYEPKDFRARRPDGRGGWLWSLKGVRLVPYRLPYLLAASGVVVVVEGEKDADTLASLGIEATTGIGGVGMGWRAEYSQALAGRPVVVVPDADEAGRKHAEKVAGSLIRHGCRVKWSEVPAPAKDVTDAARRGMDLAAVVFGRRRATVTG